MYLKNNRVRDPWWDRTRHVGVAAKCLNHSTTSRLARLKLSCLYTPRNFLGYIAEIF